MRIQFFKKIEGTAQVDEHFDPKMHVKGEEISWCIKLCNINAQKAQEILWKPIHFNSQRAPLYNINSRNNLVAKSMAKRFLEEGLRLQISPISLFDFMLS